jgi:hypothetical protein
MPVVRRLHPHFDHLISAQDFVVHRGQALAAGMTRHTIEHRLETGWQILLPCVYLTHPGEPSRRQKLIAALLYSGPDSAVDGVDACHYYGIRAARPDDEYVHVVVPATSRIRSTRWLVVRRSSVRYHVETTAQLRYVHPAVAVISMTRALSAPRAVLAVLSDAVQRNIVSVDDLVRAHVQGPRRNALHADDALGHLRAGT